MALSRAALSRAASIACVMTTACACSTGSGDRQDVPAPVPCTKSTEATPVPGDARAPIVLVVIDGARWQDVFGAPELTPALHRLAGEDGAFVGEDDAAPIRATGPSFVSLPGYVEMLTGAPPDACRDNSCPRTRVPTLLDRAADAGLAVAAFASWARVERAVTSEPGRFFVSTGKDAGAYRPDEETAAAALDHLATARPDVLFVALGDTDEDAHRGDVDAYRRSLSRADAFVGDARASLDAWGDRGRAATILVTADHGRADDFRDHGAEWPESARVWLVASGARIRARGRARSPHERRLADVGATIAEMLALDPAGAPPCGGDVLGELF